MKKITCFCNRALSNLVSWVNGSIFLTKLSTMENYVIKKITSATVQKDMGNSPFNKPPTLLRAAGFWLFRDQFIAILDISIADRHIGIQGCFFQSLVFPNPQRGVVDRLAGADAE